MSHVAKVSEFHREGNDWFCKTGLSSDINVVVDDVKFHLHKRSDGGGVFEILDRMNGPVLCGCQTLAACQPGEAYGSCKNATLQKRTPNMDSTTGNYSGAS
ncbi:PI-PLC X domain-containing protein At5g67130-like [Capsella rubella]|uniref:PI-PLC X domain-containing protein At5g67130-like n=1 Tax=Capsella rubella TaxID=81985 RepID=UPI000CD53C32|nr:PI-PLC X domain-containing protein At5g67130-like [Capsella rubella]